MAEKMFRIEGFHCEACVRLATMKIKKISDVHEVNIAQEGLAKVCAGREIALDEITKALDGTGYVVKNA